MDAWGSRDMPMDSENSLSVLFAEWISAPAGGMFLLRSAGFPALGQAQSGQPVFIRGQM
jgi:hypothetical protein